MGEQRLLLAEPLMRKCALPASFLSPVIFALDSRYTALTIGSFATEHEYPLMPRDRVVGYIATEMKHAPDRPAESLRLFLCSPPGPVYSHEKLTQYLWDDDSFANARANI